MAGYKCEKCGMSIGSMTCGQCGQELVHSTLTKADGSSVHVVRMPRRPRQGEVADVLRQGMACTI